jgi:hypothetical protein
MIPYLLGIAGGYLLGSSLKQSFANGGMISWVDEKDKHTKYWGRKADSIGSFYIKGHRDDSYLYPLSDFDKEYWKDVKLNPNEKLFRYKSYTTDIAKISPVIKINIDKSLIYFLKDLNSDDDKNLVFETRGIKPQYISLHRDILKYENGGDIEEFKNLTIDGNYLSYEKSICDDYGFLFESKDYDLELCVKVTNTEWSEYEPQTLYYPGSQEGLESIVINIYEGKIQRGDIERSLTKDELKTIQDIIGYEIEQKIFDMISEKYTNSFDYYGVDEEYYPKRRRRFKKGGETDGIDKETYQKWKSLVNMSKTELKEFYDSEEGKEAGLSAGQAKSLGIDSGRESARWIMKMKDTPVSEWSPTMWKWAKKQISFISRMRGNKGKLYDEKGNKTRKHTSLLIWGHNPEKK